MYFCSRQLEILEEGNRLHYSLLPFAPSKKPVQGEVVQFCLSSPKSQPSQVKSRKNVAHYLSQEGW